MFFRLYDQNSNEFMARAEQITVHGAISSKAIRQVKLNFCVDPEYLEFAIALGLIEADDYYSLTKSVVRVHLEGNSTESEDSVTNEALEDIVERELKMNMKERNS